MTTYSVYALIVQHPEDNVAAGDFNQINVVAADAEDAKQYAWRHAVRTGQRNEGIWINSHESIVQVSVFDEAAEAEGPGHVTETSVWTVGCTKCGTTLHKESGLWVDAISGDEGGTYDYCPENGGAHKPGAGYAL
jgi:hypothetical protein